MKEHWMESDESVSKWLRFFPWICGLIVYLIYELSNARGLYWGDAGEFIATANTLGIGHPYGHPLFWLAGRLSILLAPSQPAGAMGRFTAIVSAATCGLAAGWILRMTRSSLRTAERIFAMVIVSGTLALFQTIWIQATFVEVYNFQALFIISALILFYRYSETRRATYLYGAAFIFGLAVTLGLYVGLLLIIPLLVMIIDRKSRPGMQTLLSALVFFILGLSVWIYLPIRSSMKSIFFWERIDSIQSFFTYIGRKQFSRFFPRFLERI